MTTKITLELSHPDDVLDDLRHTTGSAAKLIADQIQAQLPKPIPPEPEGDCIVVDKFGDSWVRRVSGFWHGRPGSTNWTALARTGAKVYRPEPSPERVELLVTEFSNHAYYSADEWALDHWLEHHRRFVGTLLAGGAAK